METLEGSINNNNCSQTEERDWKILKDEILQSTKEASNIRVPCASNFRNIEQLICKPKVGLNEKKHRILKSILCMVS